MNFEQKHFENKEVDRMIVSPARSRNYDVSLKSKQSSLPMTEGHKICCVLVLVNERNAVVLLN